MDRKNAIGAAGGITLTIVGGATALLLTLGQATPAESSTPQAPTATSIQYVDLDGNPLGSMVLTDTAGGTQVALNGQPVEVTQPAAAYEEEGEYGDEEGEGEYAAEGYEDHEEGDYEEGDYEEGDHEEGDYEEEEGEYEEDHDDEEEEGDHEEDHDDDEEEEEGDYEEEGEEDDD